MTKSPFLNFLMGVVAGGLLATILVLHIVTNQVEARNAAISASLDGTAKANADNLALAQKVIDTWRGRAETCEAKFTVGTIVYQQQPLASFPMLHGVAAFDIVDIGDSKPSLYIPAQVDIYTGRPDVRYQWFDGRTGAPQGAVHVAQSPSAVQ
jgi:hypothetical protein